VHVAFPGHHTTIRPQQIDVCVDGLLAPKIKKNETKIIVYFAGAPLSTMYKTDF